MPASDVTPAERAELERLAGTNPSKLVANIYPADGKTPVVEIETEDGRVAVNWQGFDGVDLHTKAVGRFARYLAAAANLAPRLLAALAAAEQRAAAAEADLARITKERDDYADAAEVEAGLGDEARADLARRREDEGEPVTEEWLLTMGFTREGSFLMVELPNGGAVEWHRPYLPIRREYWWVCRDAAGDGTRLPEMPTRGHACRLLSAIGLPTPNPGA